MSRFAGCKMARIVAVDFFCGAGGATRGFRQAGIEVIKGIDIDATAKDTYEKNNPGSVFLEANVAKISVKKIMDDIDRKDKRLIFIGCAPCQPFSGLGRDKKRDLRKPLIVYFGDLITQALPEYVFVENVPGFAKSGNRYFKKFLRMLTRAGYFYEWRILNAKDYGIPQNRKRFVLIGSRFASPNGKFIREPGYGPGKKQYKTVRDAIARYPPIKAGQRHKEISNHVAKMLSDTNLMRMKNIPHNGGSRKQLPQHLVLECHKKHRGHSDVYGRMKWNTPSPTLTCRCTSITNGRFGHPTQNRGISAREAAALQTFPDNYTFYGNLAGIAKHIGNAVPVLFARRMAEGILKYDSEIEKGNG